MLIGLDLGTTNVKAVLSGPGGRVVARAAAPVRTCAVGEQGVEQDIEEIWRSALAALGEVARRAEGAQVQAVGVSSQAGALQMLGPDGRPLGRVISWLDGRGRPWGDRLRDELGPAWFARHVGHPAGGLAVGQLLRLRAECPGLVEPPNLIGFVGDVIVARLCGRRAHDATSLSLCVLYNPRLGAADPDLLERLGIAPEQLPDLLPARQAAGGLLPEVAEAIGLPAGIPVSPAVHDQYAAALGCGAVHGGDVTFGAGTAWVLLAVADRLPEPVAPHAFVCRHVVDGLYGQVLSMGNGGSSFDWAVRMMGLDGAPAPDIERLMASVPAGSGGVRFWPFLMPGPRAGRLAGLRLRHGRGHVLRAVVEGLALELARHLRSLTDAGASVARLLMCGGAAAGAVTPQTVADVTGLPVDCLSETEVSAVGAAVIARCLADPAADPVELAQGMSPPGRRFEPGAEAPICRRLLSEYLASIEH